MAKNALAYGMQIATDAKADVLDAVAGMSNKELLVAGAIIGLGVIFAPHLLALNGGLSIMGSFGRSSKDHVTGAVTALVDGKLVVLSDYEVEF